MNQEGGESRALNARCDGQVHKVVSESKKKSFWSDGLVEKGNAFAAVRL